MSNNFNVSLGANENVLNDWCYATTKGAVSSRHQLIVTDKRIMALSTKKYKNGDAVSLAEIPSDNVSGLRMTHASQNFISRAVMLGFMALTFLMVFLLSVIKTGSGYYARPILDFGDKSLSLIFLLGAILVGVAAVLWALKDSNSLTIVVSVDNRAVNVFGVYANAGVVLKTKKNSLKVKVDKNVAKDIYDTLGSLLLTK